MNSFFSVYSHGSHFVPFSFFTMTKLFLLLVMVQNSVCPFLNAMSSLSFYISHGKKQSFTAFVGAILLK